MNINNNDRKIIQRSIDKMEEAKADLEPIIEELGERSGNLEEKFPNKADKLQSEADDLQNIIETIDNAITDAQTLIEMEG